MSDWIKIETVYDKAKTKTDRASQMKRLNDANVLIRNTKSLSAKDMKERSEKRYVEQKIEDDKLLDAFENKRVKSKTAIKRALQLKKERAKLEKKSKVTEQSTNTESTATSVVEESKESND